MTSRPLNKNQMKKSNTASQKAKSLKADLHTKITAAIYSLDGSDLTPIQKKIGKESKKLAAKVAKASVKVAAQAEKLAIKEKKKLERAQEKELKKTAKVSGADIHTPLPSDAKESNKRKEKISAPLLPKPGYEARIAKGAQSEQLTPVNQGRTSKVSAFKSSDNGQQEKVKTGAKPAKMSSATVTQATTHTKKSTVAPRARVTSKGTSPQASDEAGSTTTAPIAKPAPQPSEKASSAASPVTKPAPQPSEKASSAASPVTKPAPQSSEKASSAASPVAKPAPQTSEKAGSAASPVTKPAPQTQEKPDSGRNS